MRLLAIDPGPTHSAYCMYETDDAKPLYWQKVENAFLLHWLEESREAMVDELVIEMVASYGMAVGKEVFETVLWIGRFDEAWRQAQLIPLSRKQPARLLYRREVKLHLCGQARAKDANIRQALLDRFGPKGTKADPGVLYGMSGDCWAALGVAVTAAETPRMD